MNLGLNINDIVIISDAEEQALLPTYSNFATCNSGCLTQHAKLVPYFKIIRINSITDEKIRIQGKCTLCNYTHIFDITYTHEFKKIKTIEI